MQVAVVEHAAARCHLKGALLLARRQFYYSLWVATCSQTSRIRMSIAQPAKTSATKKKRSRRGAATTARVVCWLGTNEKPFNWNWLPLPDW